MFNHYSFESTSEERSTIDSKAIENYNSLTNEWHSAETIVMQIDQQHANQRKNSMRKILTQNIESTTASAETALASLRNVLASLPEKFSLTKSSTLDRKDSNASNEVFFEVNIIDFRLKTHH